MRKHGRYTTRVVTAFWGAAALLLAGPAAVAGESNLDAGTSNESVWASDLSPITAPAEPTAGVDVAKAPRFLETDLDGESMSGTSREAGTEAASFTPLLAEDSNHLLASTRGLTDASSAGLFDAESTSEPAVVPLPASVWAGLGVLLTTVWLGRHSKRRLRLPV